MLDALPPPRLRPALALAASLRVVGTQTACGAVLRVELEPGFVHEELRPVVTLDTPEELHITQSRTREWIALGAPFTMSWDPHLGEPEVGQIFEGVLPLRAGALPSL